MTHKIHRLQSHTLLAAALCMALAGCGADEPSVGGPNNPERRAETYSASQIVLVAATINQGEIRHAESALDRLKEEEVRAYAEKLMTDHRTANAELTTLISTLGVTPQSSGIQVDIAQTSEKVHRMFGRAPGDRINPTFLDGQIVMHEKGIEAIDRLLAQAQQPELRTYLQNLRATMQQHLDQARELFEEFPYVERSP